MRAILASLFLWTIHVGRRLASTLVQAGFSRARAGHFAYEQTLTRTNSLTRSSWSPRVNHPSQYAASQAHVVSFVGNTHGGILRKIAGGAPDVLRVVLVDGGVFTRS